MNDPDAVPAASPRAPAAPTGPLVPAVQSPTIGAAMPGDIVEIAGARVIGVTPKAVRVAVAGRDQWVPRSLLRNRELAAVGDAGTLAIPLWFAEQEDLDRALWTVTAQPPAAVAPGERSTPTPAPTPRPAPARPVDGRFAALAAELEYTPPRRST